MNVNLEPWPHIIVDNYVDQSFIKLLTEFSNEKIKQENLPEFTEFYFDKETFSQEILDHYEIYKSKLENDTRQLQTQFPKIRIFNNNANLELVTYLGIFDKGYVHPKHCDRVDKVISVVTYIAPTHSIGTHLYNTDKSLNKTVEWIPGDTLIFAGWDGLTWHSYESGTDFRITLNSFLINTDMLSLWKQYQSLAKPNDTIQIKL